MDLGGGKGFSTADQSRAASGVTGSVSTGFTGPSGGGGNGNDDPYQGFIRASKPRGLSVIERKVQDVVQRTKDFFSQPVNRRGIIGSLIGGALLGPFGAFLGGSLGQRFGGGVKNRITDFFTDDPNPYGDNIRFTNPRFEKQFTMPMSKPDIPILTDGGITGINMYNFPPDMDLYATRPTSGYENPDRAKEKDDALEKFYQENPEFRPPEQSGINRLQFIV